jgi:hypothetical protein
MYVLNKFFIVNTPGSPGTPPYYTSLSIGVVGQMSINGVV